MTEAAKQENVDKIVQALGSIIAERYAKDFPTERAAEIMRSTGYAVALGGRVVDVHGVEHRLVRENKIGIRYIDAARGLSFARVITDEALSEEALRSVVEEIEELKKTA